MAVTKWFALPPCRACGANKGDPCRAPKGKATRPHLERSLQGRGLWILQADCDYDETLGHREIPAYVYGWIERADLAQEEGIDIWFVNGAAIRVSLPELREKTLFLLDN